MSSHTAEEEIGDVDPDDIEIEFDLDDLINSLSSTDENDPS